LATGLLHKEINPRFLEHLKMYIKSRFYPHVAFTGEHLNPLKF